MPIKMHYTLTVTKNAGTADEKVKTTAFTNRDKLIAKAVKATMKGHTISIAADFDGKKLRKALHKAEKRDAKKAIAAKPATAVKSKRKQSVNPAIAFAA